MQMTDARRLFALATPLLLGSLPGCKLLLGEPSGPAGKPTPAPAKVLIPKPLAIKTYTDSVPATALAGNPEVIWEGTARGLLRWDPAKGTAHLIAADEGVPASKVSALALDAQNLLWVVTPAALVHQQGGPKPGWRSYPMPAVGEVAGIAITVDGAAWVGGDKGLFKLNKRGAWEPYLGGSAVTCVASAGNDVWVGTRANGLLHIVPDKKADRVDAYGPDQGAELEKVTGLTATPNGVMAVGESRRGQRVVFFDGFRFWSYRVEGMETKIQWLRRIGNDALIGGGRTIWVVKRSEAPGTPAGIKVVATLSALPAPPASAPARGEPPLVVKPPEDKSAPAAKPAFEAPAPAKADKAGAKGAKGGKPARPAADDKVAARPAEAKPAGKPEDKAARPADKAAPAAAEPPAAPLPTAPAWEVATWGAKLPEDTVTIGPDGAALLAGTRFNGIARIEPDAQLELRQYDLAADGDHLYVACDLDSECWLSTGLARPWHLDGKGIDVANIDSEEGSRVMAVISPPNGGPLALSHGPGDSGIRVQQEQGGRWVSLILRDLQVPSGTPDITFATFQGGRMWLGLRYIDKLGDATDFGAAEVDLAKDDVKFHRTVGAMGATSESLLWPLPNDLTTAFFRGPTESWFGTRTGMVRRKDGVNRSFGEADGLQPEVIHDFVDGPDKKLWAATGHGVAEWDEKKWVYPGEADLRKGKITALVRDKFGWVWVGGTGGLWLCGPPDPNTADRFSITRIEAKRGLADDRIVDLAVDKFGRVWALTEKGISLLTR